MVIYVAALVVGGCLGVLLTYSTVPRVAAWPSAAVLVLFFTATATLTWGLPAPPVASLVLTLSTVVVAAITRATAWSDHPLLRGEPFVSRLAVVLFHDRALRRTAQEARPPQAPPY